MLVNFVFGTSEASNIKSIKTYAKLINMRHKTISDNGNINFQLAHFSSVF